MIRKDLESFTDPECFTAPSSLRSRTRTNTMDLTRTYIKEGNEIYIFRCSDCKLVGIVGTPCAICRKTIKETTNGYYDVTVCSCGKMFTAIHNCCCGLKETRDFRTLVSTYKVVEEVKDPNSLTEKLTKIKGDIAMCNDSLKDLRTFIEKLEDIDSIESKVTDVESFRNSLPDCSEKSKLDSEIELAKSILTKAKHMKVMLDSVDTVVVV